jgi:hypothetical protein
VETKTDFDSLVREIAPGLEYTAAYVPFSQSRRSEQRDPSLNWKVELRHNGIKIATDYYQGIGHLPEWARLHLQSFGWKSHSFYESARHSVDSKRAFDKMMETGIVNGRYLPAPSVADVLYCLLLDGETLDFGTFEEWAENFGYDTDSRKAEVIYRKCLEIGLRLRAMFGDAKLSELREALQDM